MAVMSEATARRHQITPMVRVLSTAVIGVSPALMGMGPVYATRKLLHRSGIHLRDIELFEINEAFAAQAIACVEELKLDHERVNVCGGSLAIGHPPSEQAVPVFPQHLFTQCAIVRFILAWQRCVLGLGRESQLFLN